MLRRKKNGEEERVLVASFFFSPETDGVQAGLVRPQPPSPQQPSGQFALTLGKSAASVAALIAAARPRFGKIFGTNRFTLHCRIQWCDHGFQHNYWHSSKYRREKSLIRRWLFNCCQAKGFKRLISLTLSHYTAEAQPMSFILKVSRNERMKSKCWQSCTQVSQQF